MSAFCNAVEQHAISLTCFSLPRQANAAPGQGPAEAAAGGEALPPLQLSVNPEPPQRPEQRPVEPADVARADALRGELASLTEGLLLADLEVQHTTARPQDCRSICFDLAAVGFY